MVCKRMEGIRGMEIFSKGLELIIGIGLWKIFGIDGLLKWLGMEIFGKLDKTSFFGLENKIF